MRKIIFNLLIISTVLFSICSCTFEITETKRINNPDVGNSSAGIFVTLKNSNQDTKYVNVYRQEVKKSQTSEVSNEEAISSEPVLNLGLIFPVENETTFVFEDVYVIKNHTYRYSFRLYSEVEGYTYTKWTEGFTAVNGKESESLRFAYGSPSSTKFLYDEVAKKITVNGQIYFPSMIVDDDADAETKASIQAEWSPALVFESEKGTKAFTIESIENESVIFLTNILPQEFQDIDIKFLGIVAQKIEKYKDPKTKEEKDKRIIWTGIHSIPLHNSANGIKIENQTIHLVSQYGTSGFDYSN